MSGVENDMSLDERARRFDDVMERASARVASLDRAVDQLAGPAARDRDAEAVVKRLIDEFGR